MPEPVERTHSRRARSVLYPLGGTVRGLDPLPRAPRRFTRRRLTGLAARANAMRCRSVELAAITGSMGKTTTKDLLAKMLAGRGPTLKTRGNENGIYGYPATLLLIRPDDRYAVLEIGIKAIPGEMRWMASLARPSVAVLTSIGEDHLTFYGTRAAIAGEKRRLLERLDETGTAVLNGDDPLARACGDGLRARTVTAGWSERADVRIRSARVELDSGLELELEAFGARIEGRTGLYGAHMATPVALAVAAAAAFGLDPADALERIASFEVADGRLRPQPGPRGTTWLMDDYKSRLPGQTAAIEALGELPARRRVAVLGEIDEGGLERGWRNAARLLPGRADLVVAVGDRTETLARELEASGIPVHEHARVEGAASALSELLREGDLVLLNAQTRQHLRRIKVLVDGGGIGCTVRRCLKPVLCTDCPHLEEGAPRSVVTER